VSTTEMGVWARRAGQVRRGGDHGHDADVRVEEYDKRVCRRSWRWSSSVCTTRDRSCAQRAGECAEVVPVHFVEEEENVPAEE